MQPEQSFEFDDWDRKQLRVNCAFVPLLKMNALTSFDAFLKLSGGQIAKGLAHGRVTQRFVLRHGANEHAFYLKKQSPPGLREILKPLIRLRRPILGVTHEWNAMIRFHQLGIPTMVPVAMGHGPTCCFLFTQALEGFEKLSDWMHQHLTQPRTDDLLATRHLARAVATVAKTMHAGGCHHQDFYLGHLLVPAQNDSADIHVIDLGRARWHDRLSKRWIIKDLAQLNYSAALIGSTDRLRFLRAYLNRRLLTKDKILVRRVIAKSRAIERHTVKHRL